MTQTHPRLLLHESHPTPGGPGPKHNVSTPHLAPWLIGVPQSNDCHPCWSAKASTPVKACAVLGKCFDLPPPKPSHRASFMLLCSALSTSPASCCHHISTEALHGQAHPKDRSLPTLRVQPPHPTHRTQRKEYPPSGGLQAKLK